jgi:branched-chain amino acid transport system permease protein
MVHIDAKTLIKKITQGWWGLLLLFVIICIVPFIITNIYLIGVVITIFLYITYSSSYRLVLNTGQLLFGAHGFIAVGAYASTLLVTDLGFSFWLALPLAGLITAILAVIIGYPALRVKGVYFAIITWGFAQSIVFLFIRAENIFGGNAGISHIPAPNPISIPFLGTLLFDRSTTEGIRPYYFLMLIIMIFALYVLYRLEKSRYGLIYSAIHEADILAKAVGINIMRYKVLAFAIAMGLSGLGGSFYAHYAQSITPRDFQVVLTVMLAIYVVFGGLDKFAGPIVGVTIMLIAEQFFVGMGAYKMMLLAGLMVLVMLFFPGGILDLPKQISVWIAKLRKRGATIIT